LAETIKTSGSTLNETLTSVLSYAKINQFERQQHKYRQRRPPDEDWSLPNKMHLPPGPQTEYEGLYVGTNVALLCEEVAGVLEAGQSYDKLTDPGSVTVVLEVRYEDNWNYYTEPGALRRTAVNIIGNALKYTKKGQVTITLSSSEIKAEEMDLGGDNASRRMIDLIVKDTGKGMSKEFMENHLFVPFTQEDSTSSYGVGLGMSIVKGLVTLLSGEIQVKSEQGKGTEVTISMPMRRYEPDPEELEQSTADLERRISTIRGEHLSVVLFGFPSHVRRCLETYLSEWFHCEILESADDAEPDVVVVDEGNPEVADAVERTAERYGRRGVLLSIAMIADTLAKPMRPIKGYHKWERIPRPIGPSNLGKALTACVKKLRELREPGANDGTGEHYHGEDVPDKAYKGWRDGDQSTREGASSTYPRKKEDEPPKSTHIPHERPLPIRTRSFAPSTSSKDSSIDPSNLRVLVVEDNAINRKLLGAFLNKYGCRNVQYAENGAIAVETVKENAGSFDVIFMGRCIFSFTVARAFPETPFPFSLS
jgi:AmiR/NasT family two-component response regulator